MIAPPPPPDESQRLADLRALALLDTPPEARFDRVVELAAKVFDVPIAYLALVDADRQWFKARCGLATSESGRDVSFCGHAILEDGPLIVPDATLDERFHDNPLVVGDPCIRFYAGHPLRGPAGRNVATLCLADRRPRTLDDRQMDVFRRFAALAEHELAMMDVIRMQHELSRTRERLALELSEAESFVRSLLPDHLESPVRARWEFVSSSVLGGDLLGYHWIDDQLVIYLLDVMGHGVGSALLSTSVQSALRSESLPDTDFADPAAVLRGLNLAFPMDRHGGKFFTIWYGVYDPTARRLRYASAGHPPALLLGADGVARLDATGTIIGIDPTASFEAPSVAVQHEDRLFIYSDGAFEIPDEEGELLMLDGLERVVARATAAEPDTTVEVLRELRAIRPEPFDDDVSLLEIAFS